MTDSALVGDLTWAVSVPESGKASRVDTIEEIRLPQDILERYVAVALRQAVPRQLESGEWFAELSGFRGVWADGESPKDCLDALAEVLREWLILKILDKDRDIPIVDEIDLSVLFAP